jgi:hypothetical protein
LQQKIEPGKTIVMKQIDKIKKHSRVNKNTRSILIAAGILLLSGYLLNRIINGIKLDDPLYDDSYDFMM